MPENVAKLRRNGRPCRADADDPLRRARPAARRPGARRRCRVRPPRLRAAPAAARTWSRSTTPPTRSSQTRDTFGGDGRGRRDRRRPAESACSAATRPGCRSPTPRSTCHHLRGARAHPGRCRARSPRWCGCSARRRRSQRPCRRGSPRRSTGSCQRRVPRAEERRWPRADLQRRPSCGPSCAAAGLERRRHHRAHALHSPYWWLKCAVGRRERRPPGRRTPTDGSSSGTSSSSRRTRASPNGCCRPVLGKSSSLYGPQAGRDIEPAALPHLARRDERTGEDGQHDGIPDVPGVLDCRRGRGRRRPGRRLQPDTRDDPLVPRRPLRPVEPRRVGDGPRRRRVPRRGRAGLRMARRHPAPDGSWHNYYLPDGDRRGGQARHQRRAPTSPPASGTTGVHGRPWLRRQPVADGRARARLGARPAPPRRHGAVGGRGGRRPAVGLRAPHRVGVDPARAALRRCVGSATGSARSDWVEAADVIAAASPTPPRRSQPKDRWAMDWYYPVLTGAIVGEAAKARLAEGWTTFAMEGSGFAACATSRG